MRLSLVGGLLLMSIGCTPLIMEPDSTSMSQTNQCDGVLESAISSTSNLALWLDGQDQSTLFQSNDCMTGPLIADGQVGCWKDKSFTGKNFIQATSSKRPTWKQNSFQNLHSVQFSEASQTNLAHTTNPLFVASGNTTFFVLQVPNNDGEHQIMDTSSSGVGSRRTFGIDIVGGLYYQIVNFFYLQASYNQNRILTFIENGSTAQIEESGNATVATGTVNAVSASGNTTVLGGYFTQNAYWIDSKIAEVIVFNRVLTTNEIKGIQNWLACKYSLN